MHPRLSWSIECGDACEVRIALRHRWTKSADLVMHTIPMHIRLEGFWLAHCDTFTEVPTNLIKVSAQWNTADARLWALFDTVCIRGLMGVLYATKMPDIHIELRRLPNLIWVTLSGDRLRARDANVRPHSRMWVSNSFQRTSLQPSECTTFEREPAIHYSRFSACLNTTIHQADNASMAFTAQGYSSGGRCPK